MKLMLVDQYLRKRVLCGRVLCGAGLLLFSGHAVSADVPDEPLPSLAFLEYLGEWQDGNGQLVDPIVLGDSASIENGFEKDGEEQ